MTRLGVVLCALLACQWCRQPWPTPGGRRSPGRSPPPARSRVLADVQNRIRAGDEHLKTALAALEEDARKGLKFGPVSVMDKTITPPSGDKHDYMSQAPYWWPDPSKPNGRPYIRKDGERNPEINKLTRSRQPRTAREHGRHARPGVPPDDREEYADHAARLLRVWFLDPATRMNPHLQYGQGIPGINDGRGIGIIETRGLPEMLDGALMMSGSPAWTDADNVALQEWMRAYVTWLVESPYGKDEAKNGNNHETWYDVQVAALALYAGESELARRTLIGARSRIARQIRPDGRQPRELERTRSWDYSIFNLRAFFDLATLSERANLDLWNYRTRGRPKPAQGARLSRAVCVRRAQVDRTRRSRRSGRASSTRCSAAAPRRGRNRSTASSRRRSASSGA